MSLRIPGLWKRNASKTGILKASSAEKNAWVLLRGVLENMSEASNMCPPLQIALMGVVAVMAHVDTVKGVQDDFSKIASRIKGFQAIFDPYQTHRGIPPVIGRRLERLSQELKPIETKIERKLGRSVPKRTIQALKDVDDIKDIFENLAALFERFQMECTLSIERNVHDIITERLFEKLNHVQGAGIDSQTSDPCMQGTRVVLLEEIGDWSLFLSGPRIFFLDGMAGTGKSAIARSVCHSLRGAGLLGGSFFCSRGTRDDVTRIIPTLVESLARHNAAYRLSLLDILRQTPDVAHHTVELQVKHLLEEPLCDAFGDRPPMLVFVVDALDECSDPKATRALLSALISRSRHMPIKFLLTSRPEQHIRSQFGFKNPDVHNVVRLHDIEQHIVESDIMRYCSEKLRRIREEWASSYKFPQEWPSDADVLNVTKQAGKLFIYAFTAIQFIGEENPVARLEGIVRLYFAGEQPLTRPLDRIYSLTLENALNPGLRTRSEISETKRLVAILLTLRTTLTVSMLAELIGMTTQDIRAILGRLHAVVYMPSDDHRGAVTTFHASFEDYLTTPGRAPEVFKIDLSDGHEALAKASIRVMVSDVLHFNVSGFHTSYMANSQQSFGAISIPLAYSCLHWVHHLILVPDPTLFFQSVRSLLQKKFLFWIEVLSASGNGGLAMGLLQRALTAEKIHDRLPQELTRFLRDAKDFIILGHDVIPFSTPHIYLSVLPSLSSSSMIAQAFWPQFRNTLKYEVTGIERPKGPLLQMSGHTGRVSSVAYSPDGGRIMSGSRDGTIRIWDARTGDLVIDPLGGHRNMVTSVAISPDGTYIVSGSYDKTIRLWNAQTGDLVTDPLEGHSEAVHCVAFSPDGARIASGSEDCTIRLWDARTGRPLIGPLEGHNGIIRSLAFSPDGSQIISAPDDKTIRLWDAHTGTQVMGPLHGHKAQVYCVAFSPDGKRIVSGSVDDTVRLWDARTGAPVIEPLAGHLNTVTSVAFSPDGTLIVSGSDDKTIRLWDARTGSPVMRPIEGHSDTVWSVGFSPDGTTVVSGSSDHTIRLWDVSPTSDIHSPSTWHSDTILPDGPLPHDLQPEVSTDDTKSPSCSVVETRTTSPDGPRGHGDRVRCVAFSADETQIISGSADKTILVWNTQTGSPVSDPLKGHDDEVTCIALSLDGNMIVSGSYDKTIRLWNAITGQPMLEPLRGHTGRILSAVFSRDGSRVVSCSLDGTIRVWDATTGKPVIRPLEGGGNMWEVAVSPDGTRIFSGSQEGTVQIWDALTGDRLMEPLKGHRDQVCCIALSPDGTRIASGSLDMTIRIWDARTGAAVMEPLEGHTNVVTSVTFSSDGSRVASTSGDGTVRLWDATTGVPVMKPLEGHSDWVTSVAFSRTGTRLVSGSDDSTIRVWDVTPGDSRLGLHGEQGNTMWCTLANAFKPPAATQSLNPFNLDKPTNNSSFFALESGWIKGPRGELVMWIPRDYYRGTLLPRNKLLIGKYRAALDTSCFVHGEKWTTCYTPQADRDEDGSYHLDS